MKKNIESSDCIAILTRLFFILLVFVLFFNRFWHHSLIYRDSFTVSAPFKFMVAESLKKLCIYGWDPWLRAGMPFVADIEAGYFYPLNIVYLMFNFELAHRLFILIHYPLGAIFMDMFLRRRGMDGYSSLFGALLFSISGYLIAQHSILTFLIGPALAPLALYCFDRAILDSPKWALGSGAVIAAQIFSGEPQSAGVTATIIFVAAVVLMCSSKYRRAAFPTIVISAFFSFAFSAAQLLPTLELMSFSTRAKGIDLKEATMFSFHPGRLIEIVWPNPFGSLWPDVFYWAAFTLNNFLGSIKVPWAFSNYMGFCAMALAFVGLAFSRRRWKFWVGAGMVFFLLLSFGKYTPFYGLVHDYFPFFKVFRYPEKYMAWFTGAAAIAAAMGLENIQEWIYENKHKIKSGAIVFLALVVTATLVGIELWPKIVTYTTGLPEGNPEFEKIISHLNVGIRQFLVLNAVSGLLAYLLASGMLSRNVALTLFIATVTLDCYITNQAMMPAGPRDIFDFRPLAASVLNPAGSPKLGAFRIITRGEHFRDVNPALKDYTFLERLAYWRRSRLKANLNAIEGYEDLFGNTSVSFPESEMLFMGVSPQTLETYNVRYIITGFNENNLVSDEYVETVYANPESDILIKSFKDPWSRAYWVPSAKAATDTETAVQLVRNSDLKKTIVITGTGNTLEEAKDDGMTPVDIMKYEPDDVSLVSNVNRQGWVVLSDRYYPGWTATIDGLPARIYKANVFVRAVKVSPGKHIIEFKYRSATLRIGFFMTLCSMVVALLVAAKGMAKRANLDLKLRLS